MARVQLGFAGSRWAALLSLLAAACVKDGADSPPVQGQPSDVKTVPAAYDGFDLIHPCPNQSVDYGIRGTGSVQLTGGNDVWNAGSEICAGLKQVPSIFACGGTVIACTGLGTQVQLSDWREVDIVIDQVGRILREHDWSLEVAIEIGTIPVASQ